MPDSKTPHAPPDKVEALVRLIPSMSPGLVDSLLMAHRLVVSRYEGQGQIIVRIQDVIDAAHGHKPNAKAQGREEYPDAAGSAGNGGDK